MMMRTRCVVIGGGTGSFTVLSGLKDHVSDISALVSMADDGGSTGALRDELGVLPPGDVRQCLVALSEASEELRDLFNYRFEGGAFAGHSFGNIFLSAVEKTAGNFSDAVRIAGDVLRIRGEVLPITHDNVRLAISWTDGTVVRGEGRIDIMQFVAEKGRPSLHLEPEARITAEADRAIRQADLIVIAPGDLYTSLGPLLVVDGVSDALAATSAKILYVANLVTKPGQTSGFTVAGHAAEIERFAGGPILDYVLYNTAQPPQHLFEKYTKQGEELVETDPDELRTAHYQSVGASLIARQAPQKIKGDTLAAHRSFIRHDAETLAQAVLNTVFNRPRS
jgi:uncharacterized cofD-like protein